MSKLESYLRSLSLNSNRLICLINHPEKPNSALVVVQPGVVPGYYTSSEFALPEGDIEKLAEAVEYDVNSSFEVSNLEFSGAISFSQSDWRFCYFQHEKPPSLISKFITISLPKPLTLQSLQSVLNDYPASCIQSAIEYNQDFLIVLKNIKSVKRYVVDAYLSTPENIDKLHKYIEATTLEKHFEIVVAAEQLLYIVYSLRP